MNLRIGALGPLLLVEPSRWLGWAKGSLNAHLTLGHEQLLKPLLLTCMTIEYIARHGSYSSGPADDGTRQLSSVPCS